jgi:hypothetical protein
MRLEPARLFSERRTPLGTLVQVGGGWMPEDVLTNRYGVSRDDLADMVRLGLIESIPQGSNKRQYRLAAR